MTSAMVSITAKVTQVLHVRDRKRVKRGGTKKKSNAATFSTAVSTDGPRPSRRPATVTPSR